MRNIAGLISQVAQTLWEVKDKKIADLTKQDITIVDYKKQLAKRSECRKRGVDGYQGQVARC